MYLIIKKAIMYELLFGTYILINLFKELDRSGVKWKENSGQ